MQLNINYRSTEKIINLLNNLYNDPNFIQKLPDNVDSCLASEVKIIISENVENCIKALQEEIEDPLLLFIVNKDKFDEIGALNLYNAFEKIDKYKYGKKTRVTDVLLDTTSDNPDDIMKLLFNIQKIYMAWCDKKIGSLISMFKAYNKWFYVDQISINNHADKIRLNDVLMELFAYIADENSSIQSVVNKFDELGLLKDNIFNKEEVQQEYQEIYEINFSEVTNLYKFNENPKVSTQHGVKGESHNSVIFIAKDSPSSINVRMYIFFQLISKISFSLNELEEFCEEYSNKVKNFYQHFGDKCNKITADEYKQNKEYVDNQMRSIFENYKSNKIFEELLHDKYLKFLNKSNVTNANNALKDTLINGVLNAYRLFYVGCSRARKNLVVIVEKSKISEFESEFITKFEELGFSISDDPY